MLLEFNGWQPGTLLNILQCTGQPAPATKNIPAQNVPSSQGEEPVVER